MIFFFQVNHYIFGCCHFVSSILVNGSNQIFDQICQISNNYLIWLIWLVQFQYLCLGFRKFRSLLYIRWILYIRYWRGDEMSNSQTTIKIDKCYFVVRHRASSADTHEKRRVFTVYLFHTIDKFFTKKLY
jgi:hypothetical protein